MIDHSIWGTPFSDKAICVQLDRSNCQDYREGLQDLRKTCRKLLERTDFFVPLEDPMWKRIQTLVLRGQAMDGKIGFLLQISTAAIKTPQDYKLPSDFQSLLQYLRGS